MQKNKPELAIIHRKRSFLGLILDVRSILLTVSLNIIKGLAEHDGIYLFVSFDRGSFHIETCHSLNIPG